MIASINHPDYPLFMLCGIGEVNVDINRNNHNNVNSCGDVVSMIIDHSAMAGCDHAEICLGS